MLSLLQLAVGIDLHNKRAGAVAVDKRSEGNPPASRSQASRARPLLREIAWEIFKLTDREYARVTCASGNL